MAQLKSVKDIDLKPDLSKRYTSFGRPWQDEIIYFVLVDRFHDSQKRVPIETGKRKKGFGDGNSLGGFYGGTINGITDNIAYIKKLGCTSIWLSPVFENNHYDYHGYAIENFLEIDSHFGTKEDLKSLVQVAHKNDIRVILDVVINHTGNNWAYENDEQKPYKRGRVYNFGSWRNNDKPVPIELRNPDYYFRKGMISNWDTYPETTEGDFFSLKKLRLDNSPKGNEALDIMTKIYSYWMKETDCDGFRIDTAKHVGEKPLAKFCTAIRSYARELGKPDFFIFGEVPGDDELYNKFYIPQAFADKEGIVSTYHGVDTVIDFQLHFILPKIIKGELEPVFLQRRINSNEINAVIRGEAGSHLVNFLDNHDQVGEADEKRRFGFGLNEQQIVAGLAILICLKGVPAIYYGTEQGFDGHGNSDRHIREAMFDYKDPKYNLLDCNSFIYSELSKLLNLRKQFASLRYGIFNFIKVTKRRRSSQVLFFSRRLQTEEIFLLYNISSNETVTISVEEHVVKSDITWLYGRQSFLGEKTNNTKIVLAPNEIVIFR